MVARRLPRGRHGLTRDQVAFDQRLRMLAAMADAASRKGYVGTSVGDVTKGAGVSRETFYQQFSDKLDCFLAAFDAASEIMLARMRDGWDRGGEPIERFERAFGRYIDLLVQEPAYARVFLVEVYAAGPEAMARRAQWQARLVDRLAKVLGATDQQGRFACEVLVAATGALVTGPIVEGDTEGLQALRGSIVDLVRRAVDAGM